MGNPDLFSMAEFGFWFIAKRQGNCQENAVGGIFVINVSYVIQNLTLTESLTVYYDCELYGTVFLYSRYIVFLREIVYSHYNLFRYCLNYII